eukprot:TRINITY_DN14245_c0_g1_i1.p2 TRINITY_DN14245_c0_g1~~TRINITY_DN14245_c0_g1_i1.p2  ORF type:complete len:110 (+),score=27.32 TRINITY_DN14245_c0_g1_i1:30-359(+)
MLCNAIDLLVSVALAFVVVYVAWSLVHAVVSFLVLCAKCAALVLSAYVLWWLVTTYAWPILAPKHAAPLGGQLADSAFVRWASVWASELRRVLASHSPAALAAILSAVR